MSIRWIRVSRMETMELIVSDWWQGLESLWERMDSERVTKKPRIFFSFNSEIKKKRRKKKKRKTA